MREDSACKSTAGPSCFLKREPLKTVSELSEKKGSGYVLILSNVIETAVLLPGIKGAFLAFHCLFCLSLFTNRCTLPACSVGAC